VSGNDLAFITIGHIGTYALQAIEKLNAEYGISPSLYDLRFVKPIDEALMHEACSTHRYIITVEDGVIQGGMGSAVLEFMAQHGYKNDLQMLGMPDHIIEHGEQDELYQECGYDADSMVKAACTLLEIAN
jgi:1-deoxy-D-xylulose-5-phosphate synthase